MARSNPFKTYARGARTQLSEGVFSGGMKWTQSPLPEIQSRLLVNYDVRGNGDILVPRPGLRVSRTVPSALAWADTQFVSANRPCAEAAGVQQQLILATPSSADATTGLTKATLQVVTLNPDNTVKADPTPIPANGWALAKQLPVDGVHGVPRAGSAQYRGIGTFAFGNQYFFFRWNGSAYELATTRFDATDGRYEVEAVTPKALSPKEAVLWGYNMLSPVPYTFANSVGVGLIQLQGILPYDAGGTLQLTPVQNQTLKLVCTYACPAGTTHRVVWEWKDVSGTSWTVLKDGNVATGNLAEMSCTFSSPTATAMIRVTVYNGSNTTPDQVMAVGFNFTKSPQGTMANAAQKTYTMASCEGMTYWRNQLVVWAPKEDRTLLFVSDVNAPHYFPYPNKAETFDEPIIHAMPLLDSLLVWTTTTLVQLSMSGDGLSWSKKTIQRNLNISAGDLHLLQPVKNMVFFKSGNYFYMVVPSTKSLGDLVIAPVSANIIELLDNFAVSVAQIAEQTYDYTGTLTLLHYYNFMDFEDIHNIYMFQTDDSRVLNLDLVYNSVGRYWRVYLFESVRQVLPHQQDATRQGTYLTLSKYTDGTNKCRFVFCGFDKLQPQDALVPDTTLNWEAYRAFPNWQVWDTGSREHNSDYKKRYRELQLKLNNISQEQLYFHHEFYIDGERRKGMYAYHIEHNVTPGDNYGTIYVVRELIDPSIVPGVTVLADANTDGWLLDSSLFPEMNLWKIRLAVSGKGYSPRMLLASRNEALFEMMNVNWVYRDMNSR